MNNEQLPAYCHFVNIKEHREEEIITDSPLALSTGEPVSLITTRKEKTEYFGLSKLEAFTMSAMQGLCTSATSVLRDAGLTTQDVETIADTAVEIARATLIHLQRQQP